MQLIAKSFGRSLASVAITTLGFMNKSGAKELQKVIASALANAKNSGVEKQGEFFIKEIQVLPGSAMKRFRAVSRGMAHTYKKRMSHIKVILTEKPRENQNVKIKVQNDNTKIQNDLKTK